MLDRSTSRSPLSRRLPAALAAVALLAAGCGLAPSQAATPDPATSEPRTVQIEVEGRERSYLLQPAVGLGPEDEAALVVVLHQEGATLESVTSDIELQALRGQGATLAYPAGIDTSWDAGNCCGVPSQQKIDDVAFVDAVIDDVGRHARVDDERRALVGYSSGGMLTYRYVCDRPGRVAAAVVVSGSLESPCDGRITTPDVLAVHGTADGTIGLDQPIFVERLGLAPRTATSTLATFTASAGCAAASSSRRADAEVRLWEGCRGGSVMALLVPGAGHAWEGLDASRRTEEFLRDRLLPR